MNGPKNGKLDLTKKKTEQLNLTRGQNQNQQLTFGSTTLKETPSHKYLGIILQNSCRLDEHIRSVINKTSTLISCLQSYKYKISRKALETMYKSFILPLFDYADIVWDNRTDTQSKMLENLHLAAHINPYHRRRPLERDVTTCKTELYWNSFIPSTTVEWNSLPIRVQQSTFLSAFKRSLSLSDSKVPAYYYFGEKTHKSFTVAFA